MSRKCAICSRETALFGRERVLGRYDADYIRCTSCGFIQAADPIWLQEAYSDAMTASDLGPVYRCDYFSKIVKTLIHFYFDAEARFIDYGGGHGLFVRRMRDLGYNFYWTDRYCENLFAKGFVADTSFSQKYELLTAVEVFEHLIDPWEEIQAMTHLSDNIFFTTELVRTPPPPLGQWPYYSPEHGQHIAFYTRKSLEVVAERLGAHFYSNGFDVHLITRREISERLFNFLVQPRFSEWFHFLRHMPTRLWADAVASKARDTERVNRR